MTGIDHPPEHGKVKLVVLMNGDVAESHHAAERRGKRGVDDARTLEEHEGVGRALRHAEVFFGHHMHRHIDRGLTGSFDVQRECVYVREVV